MSEARSTGLVQYLLQYNEILALLALDFAGAIGTGVDTCIDNALPKIGSFAAAEHCYVFMIDNETQMSHRVYSWSAVENGSPRFQSIPMSELAWLGAEGTQMYRAADLPPIARADLGASPEAMLMFAPMVVNDELIGFVGLTSSEEARPLHAYDARLLGYAASLFTTALERRRVEHAQVEEAGVMRALIDSLPDYLYAKDTESRFLLNNLAHAELVGEKSPYDMRGKSDFDYFPPEHQRGYLEDEQIILETGKIVNHEEPLLAADGSQRWMHVIKAPYRDSTGNIIGIVGMSRDITERKMMEDALREARDELERRVSERTAELMEAHNRLQEEMIERQSLQQRIIEAQKQAILELSTPIIPIFDQIIVMPLVGSIDTDRAQDIMRALLSGISQYHAKIVILDITGVPLVDTGVANHLNKTVMAARLKGTQTIVTGISDAIAETIIELGIDWGDIETLRDLQSGLHGALNRMGFKLVRGVLKSQ
jgi:PAS domain S-box-containing protein